VALRTHENSLAGLLTQQWTDRKCTLRDSEITIKDRQGLDCEERSHCKRLLQQGRSGLKKSVQLDAHPIRAGGVVWESCESSHWAIHKHTVCSQATGKERVNAPPPSRWRCARVTWVQSL